MKKQNILLLVLFIFLGLAALEVPTFTLIDVDGTDAKFTLFDSLSPVAGALLSTPAGLAALFLIRTISVIANGGELLEVTTIIRFAPMLFGALYFAKNSKFNILIPIVSSAVFLMSPIGREVWYFTLLWTIPVAMQFVRNKSLVFRSLGATYAQHSVGGALWIHTYNTTAEMWQGLIPVVLLERMIIAAGICLSYIFLTKLLQLFKAGNLNSLKLKLSN